MNLYLTIYGSTDGSGTTPILASSDPIVVGAAITELMSRLQRPAVGSPPQRLHLVDPPRPMTEIQTVAERERGAGPVPK